MPLKDWYGRDPDLWNDQTNDRCASETGRQALVTAASAAVVVSEFGLLGDDQGIVYLDPEVPDRALQLRVTEQELAGL